MKALVRRELIMDLVKADMDQEQMERYLKSNLESLPSEWLAEKNPGGVSENDMKEYLDDEFPESKKGE